MKGLTIAFALGLAAPVMAAAATPVATASEADHAGIDATLDAVYAVISGPAGAKRDWDKMRSLFTPDARLTAITSKGLTGGTLDRYIETSGPLLEQHGFTERELGRRIEVYGNLAHAWSSYEGVGDGGKLRLRGINSFQLVRQPDGIWKVFTILWQPESAGNPVPSDMIMESAN